MPRTSFQLVLDPVRGAAPGRQLQRDRFNVLSKAASSAVTETRPGSVNTPTLEIKVKLCPSQAMTVFGLHPGVFLAVPTTKMQHFRIFMPKSIDAEWPSLSSLPAHYM